MCFRSWTISLIALLCLVIGTVRAITTAGVMIENQASISYQDSKTGVSVSMLSNVAAARVKELRRFTLQSSIRQSVMPGETVFLPHQLINTGNIVDSYQISVLESQTANPELINPVVYIDENGNGALDSTEVPLEAAYSLQPDEQLAIIVSGRVPSDASANAELNVQVQAVSSDPDVAAVTVVDTLDVLEPETPEIRFLEPRSDLWLGAQSPSFSMDADFVDTGVYRLNSADEPPLSRDGIYIELSATVPERQVLRDINDTQYVFVDLHVAADRSAASQVTTADAPVMKVLLRQVLPGSQKYRSVRALALTDVGEQQPAACPSAELDVQNRLLSGEIFDANYELVGEACLLPAKYNDWLSVSFTPAPSPGDALLGRSSVTLRDLAIVDPVGRVFDAQTGEGIEGAVVEVFNGADLAQALLDGQDVILTTDSRGRYALPRLAVGDRYSLRVSPPADYLFPSAIEPARFTQMSVVEASYGQSGFSGDASDAGVFTVRQGDPSPVIDIPLDPFQRQNTLMINKSSGSDSVSLGDSVSYTIRVENHSVVNLPSATVLDTPPYGFKFLNGSATLDGAALQDPERQTSGDLLFNLGQLDIGEAKTLEYRLRATAAALFSDGINVALAQAVSENGIVFDSSPSRAKVRVSQSGVLSNQATVFGKIYVDSSCDNLQNQGEWPIAGVRLFLQDGTFAVTDEDGQYSLAGLRPNLHVIKVDPQTLPSGLSLKPLDTAHAADAQSRFLDLSPGDFHRADFAASCPSDNAAQVFNELQQRNRNYRDNSGESRLDTLYNRVDNPAGSNAAAVASATPDGDLSSDVPLLEQNQNFAIELTAEESSDDVLTQAPALDNNSSSAIMEDPEERIKTVTKEEAAAGTFLWPRSQFSTDGRFMAVFRSGLEPELYVNEEPVSATQIGERIVNTRIGAELVAWYGVSLAPGLNQLQVRAKDSFGNERVLASANFQRPSEGVRMVLRTTSDTLPADGGRSQLPIDILVTDSNDLPAAGVYYATLQTTAGNFVEEDLQQTVPGMQVRIDNGRAKVHLRSGNSSGPVRITAISGLLNSALTINQITANRPLVGSGFVQLGASFQRQGSEGNHAALGEEFELNSRMAFFFKGSIRNGYNLTVSYDSDKPDSSTLLRETDPNEFYSLYGDASLTGYEARSRSRLFLKVARDRHSVMWGDYLTDSQTQLDDLSRVQRTLTGFNSLFDWGKSQARVFLARQSDARETEEIRGNGTALLYQLTGAPIVVNSEVVELIVRDRNNPGLILSSEQLVRFNDYTLDSTVGLLSFANTVPSVDESFNPVFIRVSYDRETGFDEHTIAGLRLQHSFSETTRIGLSITEDTQSLSGSRISGLHAQTSFGQGSTLSVAVAHQEHTGSLVNALSDGTAQRIRLTHRWNTFKGARSSLQWAQASENFDNPGAGIVNGQKEWQFEHLQPLGKGFDATISALRSQSGTQQQSRQRLSAQVSRSWRTFSLKTGIQRAQLADSNQTTSFNSILLGAEKRFSWNNASNKQSRVASLSAEYEQDIADSSRYRQSATGRMPLHEHVSAYARYENDRGLGVQAFAFDRQDVTQLTAGIESDIIDSTRLYSEYRLRGAFDGRSMETASGIRGRYFVRKGLSLSPSLELINAVKGEASEDSIAVSLGIRDNQLINRRIGAQFEWRESESSRYTGFRASLVQRLNLDWSVLLRDQFTYQSNTQGQKTTRHEFTLGLSRRPKRQNRHHGLYTFQLKNEQFSQANPDTETLIAATVQNRAMSSNWTISGRLGFKHQLIHLSTGKETSRVWLADLRNTFDIARRWEVDVRAGVLSTGENRESLMSFGTALSWLVDRNTRLSIGYNWLGFRDSDLDVEAFNSQGLKLGLTYKFDESLLGWLGAAQ